MLAPDKDRWRRVNLHDSHNGQIVTPLVEARREGATYRVRYRMHDASMPTGLQDGEWVEIFGEYHDVSRRLQSAGIMTDDHEF